MSLQKGSKEWDFWGELFQLCKKYWDIQDTDDYWKALAQETDELFKKYKTDYAEEFLMAFVKLQERKAKNK